MSNTVLKKIEVYADWAGIPNPTLVGELHAIPSRGKEIFSFEYDKNWLRHPQTHALDPALKLFSGKHYPTSGQENFGIFLDSSPDRWGRMLMDRREAQNAREEERKERRGWQKISSELGIPPREQEMMSGAFKASGK